MDEKFDWKGRCNRSDVVFANEIWEIFGCTSMGNYHDLYLKTDVILLADILKASETFSRPPMILTLSNVIQLPIFLGTRC